MDGDKGVAAIELAAALGDKKIVLISQPYRLRSQNDGISHGLRNMPPACFCGDPYGNRLRRRPGMDGDRGVAAIELAAALGDKKSF